MTFYLYKQLRYQLLNKSDETRVMLTLQKCRTTLFIWRFLFVRCFFGGYVFSIWNRILKVFVISQAFFVDWMGVLLFRLLLFHRKLHYLRIDEVLAMTICLLSWLQGRANLVQWRFFIYAFTGRYAISDLK